MLDEARKTTESLVKLERQTLGLKRCGTRENPCWKWSRLVGDVTTGSPDGDNCTASRWNPSSWIRLIGIPSRTIGSRSGVQSIRASFLPERIGKVSGANFEFSSCKSSTSEDVPLALNRHSSMQGSTKEEDRTRNSKIAI